MYPSTLLLEIPSEHAVPTNLYFLFWSYSFWFPYWKYPLTIAHVFSGGSWFSAVRIMFSPITNHFLSCSITISSVQLVASWNNTCYIPLGSYYLCHSFFNGCCDFFHHRNPSGFILYLLDALRYGYDFTWCILLADDLKCTVRPICQRKQNSSEMYCSIRIVPFQYVLYAVY